MDIKEILKNEDELFAKGKSKEASEYLEQCLEIAGGEKDWPTSLYLLNELMGYYRSISNFDKAWEYAEQAVGIIVGFGLQQSLEGVTTYLNVANVYRATGEQDKAIEIYSQVEQAYLSEGIQKDYRLGSLYNNISVAYLELGEKEKAIKYGDMAIEELKELPEAAGELAIAYSNLAGAFLQSDKRDIEKVEQYLNKATEIMENKCKNNPHICIILAMSAYVAYLKGDKKGALEIYEKAMVETKKLYGENMDYKRLAANCKRIREELAL